MGRMMNRMPLLSAIIISCIMMQVMAQQLGNELLWSNQEAELVFENDPCLSLDRRALLRKPLPPSAQALWQVCMRSDISQFSATTLERELPRIADPEILSQTSVSPSILAIVMYPQVEKHVKELCSKQKISPTLCSEKEWEVVREAFFAILNRQLRSNSERDKLRAFQYVCEQKDRFSQWEGISSSLVLVLKGCTESPEKAKAQLQFALQHHPDLLPIIALEARRLQDEDILNQLKEIKSPDPFLQAMISFALMKK